MTEVKTVEAARVRLAARGASTTEWEQRRQGWVAGLTDDELQRVVAEVNRYSHLDENEGDRTERREAIEWLLSRGRRGCDWGIPATAAKRIGLWS